MKRQKPTNIPNGRESIRNSPTANHIKKLELKNLFLLNCLHPYTKPGF